MSLCYTLDLPEIDLEDLDGPPVYHDPDEAAAAVTRQIDSWADGLGSMIEDLRVGTPFEIEHAQYLQQYLDILKSWLESHKQTPAAISDQPGEQIFPPDIDHPEYQVRVVISDLEDPHEH